MKIMKNRTDKEHTSMALEGARYVVIDTELTGLDEKKDSIVSIGAVRMEGGRIEMADSFYGLINPESCLTAESVVIHEIMPSEVLTKPDIAKVLEQFLGFCGKDIIVGYCVDIDMDFLNRESRRLFQMAIDNPVVDIRSVGEWLRGRGIIPGECGSALPHRYQLYDIAKCLDIPVNVAHNAIVDAFITAQIFQRFIPVLVGAGIRSTEDLVSMSKKFRGGDRYIPLCSISNF